MQKREKIIVILVVIVAIYGVVDFTLSSRKKGGGPPPTQPAGVATAELTAELTALAAPRDQVIDRLAASLNEPWPGRHFVTGLPAFGGEEKVDQTKTALLNALRDKASQLVYSGYLAMGTARIAIINGLDYEVGEEINGLTITKISQDSVQVSEQGAVFDLPSTTEPTPSAAKEGPPPDHN